MGLLTEYGSDSEEDEQQTGQPQLSQPTVASTSTSKPTFAPMLPPKTAPSTGPASSSNVSLSVPAPKPNTRPLKKPVKIGFNHPLLNASSNSKSGGNDHEQESEGSDGESSSGPANKRIKLNENGGQKGGVASLAGKGKGKSALLDMLPAPKRSIVRAMGSGAPRSGFTKPAAISNDLSGDGVLSGLGVGEVDEDDEEDTDARSRSSNTILMPRSVNKQVKEKIPEAQTKKPRAAGLDLFGIGSSSTSSSSTSQPTSTRSSANSTALPTIDIPLPSSHAISSAPDAPDYVPPPPSLSDPYPGYYQLPSGSWAAYDPEYYQSFFATASTSTSASDGKRDRAEQGAAGKGWTGLDGLQEGEVKEWNVQATLKEEQRLAEERNRFSAPQLYSDSSFKPVGKTTGRAGQRHQLTSLLADAHANRQELEERIAANKRTRRESGKKFGF